MPKFTLISHGQYNIIIYRGYDIYTVRKSIVSYETPIFVSFLHLNKIVVLFDLTKSLYRYIVICINECNTKSVYKS